MKYFLSLLLLLAGSVGAQDFPFFAKDRSVPDSGPIPLGDIYIWINPTTNYVFKSNLGTTNVTTTGDPIGAVKDAVSGTYILTNSQADGQANITWLTSNHGNTNPVINCNWSQTRLFASTPVSLTNWTFIVSYLDDSGGYAGIQAGNLASGYDSNYFTKCVSGSGNSFFQANGGGTVPFTTQMNGWMLTTIYTEFSAGGGTVIIRTNGVQESTSTGIQNALWNGIKLCSNDTYRWRGDIAEVIVYGGYQTSNTVWQVENYLRRHPFPYAGP